MTFYKNSLGANLDVKIIINDYFLSKKLRKNRKSGFCRLGSIGD